MPTTGGVLTQFAMRSADDAHLVASHLKGDAGALTALIDRHGDAVQGFLRGRVGTEAEDLYQETWMRAERALDRYQDQGNFRAWLMQIARHQVIDHHRRRGARIELVTGVELEVSASHEGPEARAGARQLEACVQRAMDSLSPEMREVVQLRLCGTSFNDIAARQGVPLNTALSRMHRALGALRLTLEGEGYIERSGIERTGRKR